MRLPILIACILIASLPSGCKPRDEVRVQQSPKEPKFALPLAGTSDISGTEIALEARMLAALVPFEQQVWFFKMIGSPSEVQATRGEFRRLLESLSFDNQGEPQWDLPDSWSEKGGSGMRKATLKTGADEHAPSVSVIGLAAPQEVLANVNRWRDQLQLSPLTADELANSVDTFEVAGAPVTLVEMTGTVNPHAAMGQSMPTASTPGENAGASGSTSQTNAAEFTFDTPSDWTAAPAGGMRKAAFTVVDGERQAEITVISLPTIAGELLPNVNRWRSQLNLEPLDESSLDAAVRSVQISAIEGKYVQRMAQDAADAADDGLATVAAMVPHGGAIWFFKLTGNRSLVEREEANFENFLNSVEFAD